MANNSSELCRMPVDHVCWERCDPKADEHYHAVDGPLVESGLRIQRNTAKNLLGMVTTIVEEKRCCTVCDAKKRCHVCRNQTLYACSDCRIDLGATVYVCPTTLCRDAHEEKCAARLREKLERVQQVIRVQGVPMSVKREIEAAAIATVKCPSCDAEPGTKCHYTGRYLDGKPAFPNSVVKTHQRRLSTFVAKQVSFK